jgi:hypothetical protein
MSFKLGEIKSPSLAYLDTSFRIIFDGFSTYGFSFARITNFLPF